jgi:hypothetical protein
VNSVGGVGERCVNRSLQDMVFFQAIVRVKRSKSGTNDRVVVSKIETVGKQQFESAPSPRMVIRRFKTDQAFTACHPKRQHCHIGCEVELIKTTVVDPIV